MITEGRVRQAALLVVQTRFSLFSPVRVGPRLGVAGRSHADLSFFCGMNTHAEKKEKKNNFLLLAIAAVVNI